MAIKSTLDALRAQSPAGSLKAVTPHASNNLPDGVADALWINDQSVVTVGVIAENDSTAVTMTVQGPGILPVRAKAVRISGTTAASIVAIY